MRLDHVRFALELKREVTYLIDARVDITPGQSEVVHGIIYKSEELILLIAKAELIW